MESMNMNANDLPESLPERLRTDANAAFLEQVHLDLIEAGVEPTEETVEQAMKDRLERNREIAEAFKDRFRKENKKTILGYSLEDEDMTLSKEKQDAALEHEDYEGTWQAAEHIASEHYEATAAKRPVAVPPPIGGSTDGWIYPLLRDGERTTQFIEVQPVNTDEHGYCPVLVYDGPLDNPEWPEEHEVLWEHDEVLTVRTAPPLEPREGLRVWVDRGVTRQAGATVCHSEEAARAVLTEHGVPEEEQDRLIEKAA